MYTAKELAELYERPMSLRQIASKTGLTVGKIRRILINQGHPLRDSSESQKVSLQQRGHPLQGKKRSKATKEKIGKAVADAYSKMTDEQREDLSESHKKGWNNIPEEKRNEINDMARKAIRKARTEGSRLEKVLSKELSSMGFPNRLHQKGIMNRDLETDIYLYEHATVIEVDGPFHFEPVYGEERLANQQKRDDDKNKLLLSLGINVIRLKNMKNKISNHVLQEIKKNLQTEILKNGGEPRLVYLEV